MAMSLRIFNTASGREERFYPVRPGRVGLYVCGPTTYDYAHVGHAKTYLFYDVVKRYFRFLGYRVNHVQNFTDVDDNIFRRALKQDMDPLDLSDKYIQEFRKDMDRLGVERPDHSPRTTEHIDESIGLIERLLEIGAAYETKGDVYFDVGKSKGFGRLIHENLEDIVVDDLASFKYANPGRRALVDFAVWKKGKPWEICWDSPWGKGRPGWHTECAVMSHKYIGMTADIRGGGVDLKFPHHESERLISEVLNRKPSAKYWLHNQLVTLEGEKMSKSKGNLVTIRKALEEAGPDALRFYPLSAHYRKRMAFSVKRLELAHTALVGMRKTLSRVLEGQGRGKKEVDRKGVMTCIKDFHRSMDNDFDTPRALLAIIDLVRMLERCRLVGRNRTMVRKAFTGFQEILGIDLGV